MPAEESITSKSPVKTSEIKADSKVQEPIVPSNKRLSVVLNPNDVRHIGTNGQRRRSVIYAPPSPSKRHHSPRPSLSHLGETDGIQVPATGKIVWFAKQGMWQALDSFLDKLFQGEKIKLKFDPELLPVGFCFKRCKMQSNFNSPRCDLDVVYQWAELLMIVSRTT